ncbi:MAG: hypothetical protein EXQ52_02235 [Bryobacterales bacterium]|nr:hypothetical protein [Bryobacterales bacterium]
MAKLPWVSGLIVIAALAQRPAPEQPLPFSHKHHASTLGLACAKCHPVADPGEFAGLPPTATCMECHKAIKTDSPHIQKLTAFHKDGADVPWKRVYRIPDYVFFSHKEHLSRAKANCETCHGPVKESAALRREKEVSMGACMDCHRANQASIACNFCHEQR